MLKTKRNLDPQVNAGSMADIAFLLLIFFLVTTTIAQDRGLGVLLPPAQEDREPFPLNDRNVCVILVNSRDELLVEGEPMLVKNLRASLKEFIDNQGRDPLLSDSSQEAVVALKTDRGTQYQTYIQVLDEVKAAFHELRAEALGVSLAAYLDFDVKMASPELLQHLEEVKVKYPLRISESSPSSFK